MIDDRTVDDSRTLPVLADLTELEKKVVEAARRGEFAAPTVLLGIEDLAVTTEQRFQVRAQLIRELLCGLHGDLDPRGIQVRGVQVAGKLDLDHITAVTGLVLFECALPGGISCEHARIRNLHLTASKLTSLRANGLRTDGALCLIAVTLAGTNEGGAIQLSGAKIGDRLNLDQADIINMQGPALRANRLHTGNRLSLAKATVTVDSNDSAIQLHGAHVGGQLDLRDTKITNKSGPALHADNLQTEDNLILENACIIGNSENFAIRLPGAHINGQANMRLKHLRNSTGRLLAFSEARISNTLFLPGSLLCQDRRTLWGGPNNCPNRDDVIAVYGLTFPNLGEVSWQQWLHLLVHHTEDYSPEPFQQLATVERAAGHESNARQILISQQDDLRRRNPETLGSKLGLVRHWLWGWLGRYGYRAHRLVAALTLVLTLAAGLGYIAGQITTAPGHYAAERISPAATATDTRGTPCSAVELIGLGIDRGLPLGTTGVRTRCDLDTATSWGQMFTVAIWVLQAFVWALATLAVASFTSLVRKPT